MPELELEPEQIGGEPDPIGKGSKRGKWIVIALLAVVGVVGMAVWRLRAKPADGRQKAKESPKVTAVLHLEPFVLNLADGEEKSYLRLGVDLGMARERNARSEERQPIALLRDTILRGAGGSKARRPTDPGGQGEAETRRVASCPQASAGTGCARSLLHGVPDSALNYAGRIHARSPSSGSHKWLRR